MNYCNHYAGPCPALSTKCSAHRQINIALPHKIRIQSATQILIKIQKHECRHQDFQQTFQKQNFLFVFFDSICYPDWLGWCWVAFLKKKGKVKHVLLEFCLWILSTMLCLISKNGKQRANSSWRAPIGAYKFYIPKLNLHLLIDCRQLTVCAVCGHWKCIEEESVYIFQHKRGIN